MRHGRFGTFHVGQLCSKTSQVRRVESWNCSSPRCATLKPVGSLSMFIANPRSCPSPMSPSATVDGGLLMVRGADWKRYDPRVDARPVHRCRPAECRWALAGSSTSQLPNSSCEGDVRIGASPTTSEPPGSQRSAASSRRSMRCRGLRPLQWIVRCQPSTAALPEVRSSPTRGSRTKITASRNAADEDERAPSGGKRYSEAGGESFAGERAHKGHAAGYRQRRSITAIGHRVRLG